MIKFLKQFFTWWNGQTLGTRFYTWRKGTRIGEDQFGNVYYQGPNDPEGRPRRWVIFSGYAEASAIPPGWHGWMHHRTDTAPTEQDYVAKPWEAEHQANLTGSAKAYRPKGSTLNPATRPVVTGDYDAWSPGS